jgi:hypothetical protein
LYTYKLLWGENIPVKSQLVHPLHLVTPPLIMHRCMPSDNCAEGRLQARHCLLHDERLLPFLQCALVRLTQATADNYIWQSSPVTRNCTWPVNIATSCGHKQFSSLKPQLHQPRSAAASATIHSCIGLFLQLYRLQSSAASASTLRCISLIYKLFRPRSLAA